MNALIQPPQPRTPMTVDEFIAWPGDGVHKKFQLVDGAVRAMSPASTTHGALQANLAILIGNRLSATGSPCMVFTEPAVSTRLQADTNVRVPDLGVSCAANAPAQIFLPDPILLIEILSPGNKQDTWDNVWAYASIPTVSEILVVQSTRIEAELLRRDAAGAWPSTPERIAAPGRLNLVGVGLDCPLTDVYAKTYLIKS